MASKPSFARFDVSGSKYSLVSLSCDSPVQSENDRKLLYLAATLMKLIHCSSVTSLRAPSKISMLTPLVIREQLVKEIETRPLLTTKRL